MRPLETTDARLQNPWLNPAGKLRALAVSSPKRSSLVPNLPTIAEAALPGYVANHWNALYAPANTPAPVVRRLNELLRIAMATEPLSQFAEQKWHGGAPDFA